MKRFVFLVLTLCCVAAAAADLQNAAESLFAQANNAYIKGRYRQAASLYMAVVHKAGISAELLGSLADSYAGAGQIGLAVLNYERALRLAPHHAVLQANLQQLRKETGLLIKKQSLPERLAGLLGADQWLFLSGTAFVLLSLTVLAAGAAGRKRFPWAGRLSLIFLLASLLPLPPAMFRYQAWQDGVVINSKAELLISPFAQAETVCRLKDGSIIRPLDKEYGQYALVRDESGHKGWLDKGSFQLIVSAPQ